MDCTEICPLQHFVTRDSSKRPLVLSDDLWLTVLQVLAEDSYRDLISFAGVCRRFSELASANYCWYQSYRAVYPSLTRSLPYREHNEQPPDWRKKLAAAVDCVKKWEAVERKILSPPSPIARVDSGFEDMDFGLSETPDPAPPQVSKATSTLTNILPQEQIAALCPPSQSFTYTSIIPDRQLDFPSGSPDSLPGILVGLTISPESTSMSIDGSDARAEPDEQSTVVFLDVRDMTVKGNASFSAPDTAPVLRYLDTDRDLFVLACEQHQRWGELQFHRVSSCCLPADPSAHSTTLSALMIPDDLECYAIAPYPENLAHLPRSSLSVPPTNLANPTQTVIILALSDSDEGAVLAYDYSTSVLLSRNHYGTDVHSISLGDPYMNVVVTGHADHTARIWDFKTCAQLLVVQAPEGVGRPVLGTTWVDEPENWIGGGAWVRPRRLGLVSFTDWMEEERTSSGGAGQPQQQPGIVRKPAGDFVAWDLTQHIIRARSRLSSANGRTVSLPPLEIDSSAIMLRHRVALDEGDEIAIFAVCWPVLVVFTVNWMVIVTECETGRVICRANLGCDGDGAAGEAIQGFSMGVAGELLVFTKRGVIKLVD